MSRSPISGRDVPSIVHARQAPDRAGCLQTFVSDLLRTPEAGASFMSLLSRGGGAKARRISKKDDRIGDGRREHLEGKRRDFCGMLWHARWGALRVARGRARDAARRRGEDPQLSCLQVALSERLGGRARVPAVQIDLRLARRGVGLTGAACGANTRIRCKNLSQTLSVPSPAGVRARRGAPGRLSNRTTIDQFTQ